MNFEDLCRDEHRRERVRETVNGIDYVDAGDDRSTLTVHFFNAVPQGLTPAHFRLTGGRGSGEIRVRGIGSGDSSRESPEKAVELTLSRQADLGHYTIAVSGIAGIDPLYASASVIFSADRPSALDCAARDLAEPPPYATPDIDYLAKDYASFRQLMLDRLATTMPSWSERHVPDLGIAIVELLAYAGDHLSYYQDAVATEAYLRTARRRISVRRHARLVDYAMHEGCNARALLHLASSTDRTIDLADTFFITSCRATGSGRTAAITIADLERVPVAEYEVFEPLMATAGAMRCPRGLGCHPAHPQPERSAQPFEIVAARSEMRFYTWGSRTCWLREGATSATLFDAWADDPVPVGDDAKRGDYARGEAKKAEAKQASSDHEPRRRRLRIAAGDIVIFEERRSPATGALADADPGHRHAVRVTAVEPLVDPLYDADHGGRPVVNITWSEADALPFDLCLAALGPAPACRHLGPDPDRPDAVDIVVALGNVILVDHGRSVAEAAAPWAGMIGGFEANAALGEVPSLVPEAVCDGEARPVFGQETAAVFQPALRRANLTFSAPYTTTSGAATGVVVQDPRASVAQVTFDEVRPGLPAVRWEPRTDLLDSDPLDRHFAVEVDDERVAHVRFGEALEAGGSFRAQYRIGSGRAGNVGADAIRHIVSRGGFVTGHGLDVRNPLAAAGGLDPEPVADVRLTAPHAFRATLERAVTADDYARLAERDPRVQRASGRIAWNGSRQSVVVAIDPLGRIDAEPRLLSELKRFLFRYRRIGHDLEVVAAAYVPLALAIDVRVQDGYLRGHVLAALLDTFSNRRLPGGALGFFHPDRMSFGENVYPSRIVAAAQRVEGVDSAAIRTLTRFEDRPPAPTRRGDPVDARSEAVLVKGVLELSSFEIARLDNDPDSPERGSVRIDLEGGR